MLDGVQKLLQQGVTGEQWSVTAAMVSKLCIEGVGALHNRCQ